MHEAASVSNIAERGRIREFYWAAKKFRIRGGQPMQRGWQEPLTIISPQNAKLGIAQLHRLLKHRLKHRREVARR